MSGAGGVEQMYDTECNTEQMYDTKWNMLQDGALVHAYDALWNCNNLRQCVLDIGTYLLHNVTGG